MGLSADSPEEPEGEKLLVARVVEPT